MVKYEIMRLNTETGGAQVLLPVGRELTAVVVGLHDRIVYNFLRDPLRELVKSGKEYLVFDCSGIQHHATKSLVSEIDGAVKKVKVEARYVGVGGPQFDEQFKAEHGIITNASIDDAVEHFRR